MWKLIFTIIASYFALNEGGAFKPGLNYPYAPIEAELCRFPGDQFGIKKTTVDPDCVPYHSEYTTPKCACLVFNRNSQIAKKWGS